jgi:DNA-binding response OmpR family regulator
MTTILIIEDEDILREIIAEILTAENFNVLEAENGKDGLEIAFSQLPDLIICDVMMPEMDGYQVLHQLRQDLSTTTIPFIFLTAKASKSDQRQGMDLGADDYLTKPFTRKELLGAVHTRLGKKKAFEKKSQQSLEKLRNNLTRSLPHELRTPLNGIIASADILQQYTDSMDAEEIKELALMIKTSGERLYNLIQKFLIYSKLELSAKNSQELEQLLQGKINRINHLIKQFAEEMATNYRRREDLVINITDISINVAENWFMTIVKELVDNAFKYSSSGTKVIISNEIKHNYFILSVNNCGRGMTSEQIHNIGAYMQFGREIYEQQGTGLGLSICKLLAELYGGQLTIESIPEQETTIFISLPITETFAESNRPN